MQPRQMGTFRKLLQMLATLAIGSAMLWLMLALTSPLKGRCDALLSLGACRMLYACLTSLLLFVVAYFTLRQLKRIVGQ